MKMFCICVKKTLLTAIALLLFINLNAQTVVNQGRDGDHPDVHAQFGCALSNGVLGWYFDILPWEYLNPALDQATIVNAEVSYMYWDGISDYDIVGTIFSDGPILDEVMNGGSFDLSLVLGDLSELVNPVYVTASLYFDDGSYMCWTYTIEN